MPIIGDEDTVKKAEHGELYQGHRPALAVDARLHQHDPYVQNPADPARIAG